jgi:L-threonylcarbamoyladenylate synthase
MMEVIFTKIWNIHIDQRDWQQDLAEAATELAAGKPIAFPTETVYGLGGDARNDEAVQGIFAAKGRPADNPLIVHIYDRKQLQQLVVAVEELAVQLMDAFWPGPLTIIMPVKRDVLSNYVTAGLHTVGIRMPDHPIALELMRQAGVPVAAPSANTSGRPSPTTAAHVYQDLQGKIAGIVDAGATGVGLESTVVELLGGDTIAVLRPGGVTIEQLQECCPHAKVVVESEIESESIQVPRAPGMKYTHYAPQGTLTIVKGEHDAVAHYIEEQLANKSADSRCGVLCFDKNVSRYQQAELVISLGDERQLAQAANRLYDALRRFDEQGIQTIWSEASESVGLGAALMNRLLKAAGYCVIEIN